MAPLDEHPAYAAIIEALDPIPLGDDGTTNEHVQALGRVLAEYPDYKGPFIRFRPNGWIDLVDIDRERGMHIFLWNTPPGILQIPENLRPD